MWLQAVSEESVVYWEVCRQPVEGLGADITHWISSLSLESLSGPCGFGSEKAKVEALPTGQLKSAN